MLNRRRARRDSDAPPDPELEQARARLVMSHPGWPRHASGRPYPPELTQVLSAGLIRACGWCGGPAEPPAPPAPLPPRPPRPSGYGRAYAEWQQADEARTAVLAAESPAERLGRAGWSTCTPCQAGVDAHGQRWPVAAALDRAGAHDGEPARAVILDRYTVRRDSRDFGPAPFLLEVPAYHETKGTDPSRPVRPWSHLDVTPGRGAQRFVWVDPDRSERVPPHELTRWPSVLQVVRAELANVRQGLYRNEAVPPPVGEACWWCGVATAPRAAWELRPDRPWCGMNEQCPAPTGHDLRDRVTALGRLLGEPVDLMQTARLQAGDGGLVWWGEFADDDRPAPGSKPFAWVSKTDRERWTDFYDRAFFAVDDRMAARDAERAQADAIAGLAETVARNTATDAVVDAGQQIARQVTKAVNRDQRRQASAQPGPTVTHRDQAALDRVRGGQNRPDRDRSRPRSDQNRR